MSGNHNMYASGPAFPDGPIDEWGKTFRGMTLRDYFAAAAMQAILSNAEVFWDGAAPLAYKYADAMLEARK